MKSRLIILVEREYNVKADGDGADGDRIDGSRLGIEIGDIDEPKMAKGIRVDIVTSKSRTPILLSSYLQIAILLRLTMHQP